MSNYLFIFFFGKFRAFLVRRSCNIPFNTEDLNDTGQHFCLKCCKCAGNWFCSITCIPLNTEDLNDMCQHFCLKCCKCAGTRFCSITCNPCQETWPCFNNFVWVFLTKKGQRNYLFYTYQIQNSLRWEVAAPLSPLATPPKCLIVFY